MGTINFVKQAPVVKQMEEYIDIVEEEKKFKPRLFKYPDWKDSMTVFDVEELEEDALLVLCKKPIFGEEEHKAQNKVFIWRGPDFDSEEEAGAEVVAVQDFIKLVMEQYWGCKSPED